MRLQILGSIVLMVLATTNATETKMLLTKASLLQNQRTTNVEDSSEQMRRHYRYASILQNYHNIEDVQFFGHVEIGTPPQRLRVLFDTGSEHFWVPSILCKETDKTCRKHRKYNNTESSTYRFDGTPANIQYGAGGVIGFYCYDTIKLGGFTMHNQRFVAVTEQPEKIFLNARFDGIIGLSYNSTIMKQIHLYSLFFRKTDYSSRGWGIFGKIDHKDYWGAVTYVNVTREDYWEFPLESMQIGDTQFCAGGCKAIADSGTALMIGPYDAVQTILDMIGGNRSASGQSVVSCVGINRLPSVNLTIAGRTFTMLARDYILHTEADKMAPYECVVGFLGSSMPTRHWIFGNSFIGAYYTVFDRANGRIGFAETLI